MHNYIHSVEEKRSEEGRLEKEHQIAAKGSTG